MHPGKFFNDYILRNIRPDGRRFRDHRNIKLNVNSITAADASAVVKCGNTTVICGIKLVNIITFFIIIYKCKQFLFPTCLFGLLCSIQPVSSMIIYLITYNYVISNR